MPSCLSVSAASPYQEQLRDYTESLLRQRCTKPSWCIIGLDADVPVARAALWALPGAAVPTDIVLIEADWDDSDLAGGHELLAPVHDVAATFGATGLRGHSGTACRAA